MNLSKLLKSFTQQKSTPPPPPAQNYNLSQNYYPQEAYCSQSPQPPSQSADLSSPQTPPQKSSGGLDIQSLLPLLAGMNGGANGLNIASLLGGAKDGGTQNPLSSIASIFGGKKDKDDNDNVDLNKNSQLKVENFKKISDLDD